MKTGFKITKKMWIDLIDEQSEAQRGEVTRPK